MEVFGLGKKKSDKTTNPNKAKGTTSANNSLNLKHLVQNLAKIILRFQTPIIAISIGILLTVTALRMLSYSNPEASDERIQQNQSKFKKIHIDSKVVERINQLSDTQTSTSANVKDSRNSPFSE